jgi:hypothetical protein
MCINDTLELREYREKIISNFNISAYYCEYPAQILHQWLGISPYCRRKRSHPGLQVPCRTSEQWADAPVTQRLQEITKSPKVSPDLESKPAISRTRSSTLIARGFNGYLRRLNKPETSPK